MTALTILAALGNGFMQLVEMLIDKLRVNVVIVALLVTWIVLNFGDRLIDLLGGSEVEAETVIAAFSLLIGVGIGGLISAMVRMFESPNVPGDIHERLTKDLVRRRDDDSFPPRGLPQLK